MAEEIDAKSFTSWKMDWINALMIGVGPREFRVAVCLLQHANSRTKLIMPAQARVAKLLGSSTKAVERAVKELITGGWIEVTRTNRQRSNHYQFVEAKRMAMIDLRQSREDEWEVIRRRSDQTEVRGQELPDQTQVSPREQTEVSVPDQTEVGGKHLKGTPEGEHLNPGHDKKDIEVRVYAHARPENGTDAAARSYRPQPNHTLPPAQTSRFGTVDPFASLDALEIEMQERQAKMRRREYQQ